MGPVPIAPEEVARRGESLYQERIRQLVEPAHRGEFLVINILNGEFEMDADDVAASARAKSRFGDAPLFSVRIGHPAAYRLGGRFRMAVP